MTTQAYIGEYGSVFLIPPKRGDYTIKPVNGFHLFAKNDFLIDRVSWLKRF
ncbi:hypothetical protein [Paenibacillus germinis]|uniref:hypothetical protein n=1 Tax=Paenibacillus germinis TaxID=2654979 RepID=UPI0014926450|nr:hypothetical protein [Paenibacillus germinis]